MIKNQHGGRRHGLVPAGEAPTIKLRLSHADLATLDSLVSTLEGAGVSVDRSKLIRALIRHPDASIAAASIVS